MPGFVQVWDPFIRTFHWALVLSIGVAWNTGDAWNSPHETAGYVASGLVAARIAWGFIGPRFARFSQFVHRPSVIIGYLGKVLADEEKPQLGHNPAGGLMIISLLGTIIGLGLTGWLATTNAFWGSEWLEVIHEVLANLLLVLIVIHVGGVIFTSKREKQNLAWAMVTGRKRAVP